MIYMDMFVGPVLASNKEAYGVYAQKIGALTLQAGALSATACWGLEQPQGMVKPLAAAVELQPGEMLVTRIVRWKSKEAREEGWAELMKNPQMQAASTPMPFDRTRVLYAGFEEL